MDWFIHSIASYSLTIAYLESPLKIFEWLRNQAKRIHPDLVECPQCSGLYISMAVYVIFFNPTGLFDIVLHGLFASGMMIFYDKLVTILTGLVKRVE